MTMSEQLQQTDWLQTELESMSLQEASLAKTFQLLDDEQVSKASAVGYGQSVPVLLGRFDPDTLSLKTSETCLVESKELGLNEFSGTFPRSGMMRSGTVYQLPNLARTITEIGSGSFATQNRKWPTPSTRDYKGGYIGGRIRNGKVSWDTLDVAVQHTDNQEKTNGTLNPTWGEWLMGFPLGHTDLNA